MDFMVGGTALDYDTTAAYHQSTYSRYALASPVGNGYDSNFYYGTTWAGGEVTDGWLHCIMAINYVKALNYDVSLFGFGCSSAATPSDGLYIGHGTNYEILICKIEGGSQSVLATAASAKHVYGGNPYALDIHLESYGASGTLTVYLNQAEVVTYTGDISLSGISGFDRVNLTPYKTNQAPSGYRETFHSQVIAADEDTRTFSLRTHHPTGAGDTNDWDGGTYASIDELVYSEADLIYTDTADEDFQANLADAPADVTSVKAIIVSAWAAKSSDASIETLELGTYYNSTIDVDAGHTLDTAYANYHRVTATINGNPITSIILDSMQLDLQSES